MAYIVKAVEVMEPEELEEEEEEEEEEPEEEPEAAAAAAARPPREDARGAPLAKQATTGVASSSETRWSLIRREEEDMAKARMCKAGVTSCPRTESEKAPARRPGYRSKMQAGLQPSPRYKNWESSMKKADHTFTGSFL